jgi:hypothetical protein
LGNILVEFSLKVYPPAERQDFNPYPQILPFGAGGKKKKSTE